MKIGLIYILLIASLLSCASTGNYSRGIASLESASCTRLFQAILISKKLEVGAKFKILNPNTNKAEKMFFVGRSKDAEGMSYYFYSKDEDRLFQFYKDELSIDAVDEDLYFVPQIHPQVGQTCAANSTGNCINLLRGLRNSSLETKNSLTKFESGFFDDLLEFLTPEVIAMTIQTRNMGRIQSERMVMTLRAQGFAVQESTRIKDLIKHLETEKPAILNVDVSLKKNPLTAKNRFQDFTSTVPYDRSLKKEGGHSVLAIGYFKTGFFKGKFLILDSYSGRLVLWDEKKLASQFISSSTPFLLVR